MGQTGKFQAAELKETCNEQQSAPRTLLVLSIIGEINATVSRPHCAKVTSTLKPVHTVRQPSRNCPVGASVPGCSLRRRLISAKSRITGLTAGTIIATIMTAHIRNTRTRSQAVQMLHSGHDDHLHPDIHMAHSPIQVNQVCPRKNRDSRKTKGDDCAVALENFYRSRAHGHADSLRLVSERRKESVLVRQLPLLAVVAEPHLFGFGYHRGKARNQCEGGAGDSHIPSVLSRQPLNL